MSKPDREAGERQRDADYRKIIAWLEAHGEFAGNLDALDAMIALADGIEASCKIAHISEYEAQQSERRLVGEVTRLTARLRAGESILRAFTGYYPCGVNPYLDNAYGDAQEWLRAGGTDD